MFSDTKKYVSDLRVNSWFQFAVENAVRLLCCLYWVRQCDNAGNHISVYVLLTYT